jgi:spermidine synthase
VLAIVYLVFFLSGAAALIYEVVWVRSFSLVFGGSHLAVTTVLSVYMAGLALGSYVFGKRIDAIDRPLKIYGLLELGIAISAVLFAILMKYYPYLYTPRARGAEGSPYLLSFLRVLFAIIAMIVPTTLMGGTLPVLSRFVSYRFGSLGEHLSFLYGFNTLGAVAGAMAAGFLFLYRKYDTADCHRCERSCRCDKHCLTEERAALDGWEGKGGFSGRSWFGKTSPKDCKGGSERVFAPA